MTKIGGGLSSACQLYGHLKVAMLVAAHQTIFFSPDQSANGSIYCRDFSHVFFSGCLSTALTFRGLEPSVSPPWK